MADVNWLLATLAQSAAALVAIVGGFLISRVIGLAGDRDSLRRRIGALTTEIQERRATLAQTYRTLKRQYAIDLLVDVPDLILDTAGEGLEEAVRDASGTEDAEFVEIVRELVQQAWRLREEWEQRFVDGEPAPKRSTLEQETDAPYVVVSTVYDFLRAAHRPPSRQIQGTRFTLPAMPTADIVTAPSGRTRADYIEELQGTIAEEEAALRVLEGQVGHLRASLSALRVPPEFGKGLAVLSWLAFFGIAVPVGLMVGGPKDLPLWVRVLVVVGPGAGLLGLVAFMGLVARSVDADTGEAKALD